MRYLAFLALVVAGCAAVPAPPPAVVTDEAPVAEKIDTGPTFCEQDVGGMNQEAIEKAFASLPVQRCLEQGAERVGTLGGHFTVALRIDKQGAARWAYLRESTLGDRETEKCVLDLARQKTWPRPVGGEGLAERSFDIDAQREPLALDQRRFPRTAEMARAETMRCRRDVHGPFTATLYVATDGRVAAAGVSPPNEKGEEAADCVADAVRRLRFPSQGGEAKVSFEIR